MSDNKVKVEYTAVPLEDPDKTSDSKKTEGKTHQKNDGLPTYFVNNSTHECYFRCQEKRKVWKKALISILVVFLVSKLLFGLHTFFVLNEFNDEEDQYLWVEVQEPGSSDVEAEGYASTFGYPSLPFPISQKCEPDIKWEGPNEILIDTKNTSGLIFKVKGLSARGSVTIRQDPRSRDFINVTNNIYIGDESLRERVDIKISYSDDDYLIVVETPSFFFPPKKGSCVLIDTIITIPYTVNVFRSLSIDAPNNWITTDSLGSIDFAYVNLKTVNGHIRVDDLTSANADVSTVNGHVSGVFIVGENLEVRSVNGPVNINVIPNPFSDSIFAGMSSFNGNLNVEVNELMKYQKIELKGHTVNGGIIATMPKTYKGDLLVSSVTGYAYVEGKGITLRKDTHNLKEGYKGDGNKKHHCKHVKQNSNSLFDDRKSNLTLTVVTGASELYFD